MDTQTKEFSKRQLSLLWLLLIGLLFASIYIFLELVGDVWLQEGFSWDVPIMQAIRELSSPALDVFLRAVTFTGGSWSFIPIGMICIWLWYLDDRYQVYLLLFSLLVLGGITQFLKQMLQRPRPEIFVPVVTETSYSFPSAHTATAISFYGLLGAFLWYGNHRIAAIACWVWVGLVALSRIYLGVHYPSDVLASLTLGVAWIILIILRNPRNLFSIRQLKK